MDPNLANLESQETQEEFDTSSALADISSELFGQGGSDDDGAPKAEVETPPEGAAVEVPGKPSPVDNPPPSQEETPPAENTPEVQATGAPSTWTKEALAEWAMIPPRSQAEILKREEDFLKGITQYKGRAELGDRYDQVVEPYREALSNENIDPVQLFQSFAANHYLLARGTEAQKLELAAQLITGYGIDFSKLVSHVAERMIDPPDPRVAELEARVSRFEQAEQARSQSAQKEAETQLLAEVDSMAKDPAYPYFEELLDDMIGLFNTKQAGNLKEAYEKAVYLNPSTREKEIARIKSEAAPQPPTDKARDDKGRFVAADVTTDPQPRNGTVPVGTIDDTLDETMAKIKNRG